MKYFEKNAKVVRYNKDGTKTVLYDDLEKAREKSRKEKKKKGMQKKAYNVKTAPKKELEEYLEATPAKPMLGGAAVGAVYGAIMGKPKLRYSMAGGAAAWGALDAVRKNLAYEELKKREKK